MKFISIEIGSKNIKIVEGKKNKNNIVLENQVLLKTPLDSVENGTIIDADILKEVIDKALKENNIRTKKVIFNININSLITRNLDLPILKVKDETLSMIKYELEQYLPVSLDNYNLIYKLVEKHDVEGEKKGNYNIYAIPNDTYDSFLELADKLKLNIISLDLSYNSLDRIIKPKAIINNYEINKDDVILLINIGHKFIVFNVIKDGVNDFSRVIEHGGEDIDIAIKDALNIDIDFASERKHAIDILENNTDDLKSDTLVKNIVINNIDIWVNEISKLIKYYTSKNKDVVFNKTYIYGGSSKIPNIDKYLSEYLGLQVELINNISNIKSNESYNNKDIDIRVFLSAIGGLNYSNKNVNFLSYEFKRRKLKFNKFAVSFFVITSVVIALFLYLFQYNLKIKGTESELEVYYDAIKSKTNIESMEEVNENSKRLEILKQYKDLALFISLNVKKEDFVNTSVIQDISDAIPIDTSLNSMMINNSAIQIQGQAYSLDSIAQFERNLKNIGYIDNIHIPSVSESEDVKEIYSFVIICSVKDVNNDEVE